MSSDSGRHEVLIDLDDAAATEALGEAIGARLEPGQGLALVGELGAGKTCLARGVARGLQIEDPDAVASPTYLLVIEHPGPRPMLHIDAYLPAKTRSFLLDGGLDYLDQCGAVVVVEWADRVADLMPEHSLRVELGPRGDGRPGRRCRLVGGPPFRWIEKLR